MSNVIFLSAHRHLGFKGYTLLYCLFRFLSANIRTFSETSKFLGRYASVAKLVFKGHGGHTFLIIDAGTRTVLPGIAHINGLGNR